MTRSQLIELFQKADPHRPAFQKCPEVQLHPDPKKRIPLGCRHCRTRMTDDYHRSCLQCRRKYFLVGPPEPPRAGGVRLDAKPRTSRNRTE